MWCLDRMWNQGGVTHIPRDVRTPAIVLDRRPVGVCPSLSEVEDVPLKALCKTRILLVGFGYNETNLESFPKLTACSWAGSGRCRGNEARSDHDLAVSLAI
jgi:hypothetical protein